MPTTSQLVDMLQKGQAQVAQYAAGLSKYERKTSGTPERWGPRDILAHIGAGVLQWAATLANGEAPAPASDPEAINQAMFEAYRNSPWSDIAGLLERAFSVLIQQVRGLSDDEINDPHLFPWMNGSTIWRQAAANGFVHPMTHLFQAYLQEGDPSSAWKVGKLEMDQCLKLDSSQPWLGLIYYNQACRLAQVGEKDRSLAELRRSLSYAPGYAGFAREDSNLLTLHGEQEFANMTRAAITSPNARPVESARLSREGKGLSNE